MAKLTGVIKALSKGKTLTAKQKAAALAKAKKAAENKKLSKALTARKKDMEKPSSKAFLSGNKRGSLYGVGRPIAVDKAIYEAQDHIKRLAKKAGLSVKAFRRKNPNNKWVKQLYKARPIRKEQDAVLNRRHTLKK